MGERSHHYHIAYITLPKFTARPWKVTGATKEQACFPLVWGSVGHKWPTNMYFQPSYTKVPGANWLWLWTKPIPSRDERYIYLHEWLVFDGKCRQIYRSSHEFLYGSKWSRPNPSDNLIFQNPSSARRTLKFIGKMLGKKNTLGMAQPRKKMNHPH